MKPTNAQRRISPKSGQTRSFDVRKKRRLIMGGILGAAGLASWIFVFYRIAALPAMALTEVHVYGAEGRVANHLAAAAYGALEGSYLGILSKANAVLYPKGAVEDAVAAASASVGSVKVRREGLHSLAISIEEKTPAAIACAGLPDFTDSGAFARENLAQGSCYFTDEAGYIFKKIPADASAAYNIYYVPAAADEPTGHYATSTKTFKTLQAFMSGVRASGIVPDAMLVKPEGEYELYVRNPDKKASSTAIVYFNESTPLSEQLANLSAFWNKMKGSFEYIDVRYGSNVFYRLIQ